MKEVTTRAISGLLYVGLILGSISFNTLAFYGVIGVFSGLALWEFQRLIGYQSLLFIVLLLSLFTLSFLQLLPREVENIFLALAIFGCLFSLIHLQHPQKRIPTVVHKFFYTSCYLLLSCIFIPKLLEGSTPTKYFFLLVFYIGIWVNNSFAYLVGSRYGKHKIIPSVSPKKTWEGYFGGAFSTLIFLFIFQYKYPVLSSLWIVLGLGLPLFATVGDLVQSSFKRSANVKDSGSLIPGHGGFYDRMDSVIFTAPFYYLFLKILHYVP